MATRHPVVGDWYQTADGELFEVVAYDVDEQSIEIQYADGTIEELDLDGWLELPLLPAEPPTDWSRAMDLAPEDLDLEPDHPLMQNGHNVLDDHDALR